MRLERRQKTRAHVCRHGSVHIDTKSRARHVILRARESNQCARCWSVVGCFCGAHGARGTIGTGGGVNCCRQREHGHCCLGPSSVQRIARAAVPSADQWRIARAAVGMLDESGIHVCGAAAQRDVQVAASGVECCWRRAVRNDMLSLLLLPCSSLLVLTCWCVA